MGSVRPRPRADEAPPQRRPLVVANWKMYVSAEESVRTAQGIRGLLARHAGNDLDVVLCPSFPSLAAVRQAVSGSRLLVGAQDVHQETSGPFTGDVSASQLSGLAEYVIVGHSERRAHHGDTDAVVAQKARRALAAGIHPVICVGETASERERGESVQKISAQLHTILPSIQGLSLARCVFAYEPLWAVSQGPGQPSPQPESDDVTELVGLIRRLAAEHAGRRYADRLRILYGGSVEAQTASAFAHEPGVDGFLVGGASTRPSQFAAIAKSLL